MSKGRTDYTTLHRPTVQKDWTALKLRYQAESRALDAERYKARTGRAIASGDRKLLRAYIAQIEV